MTRAFTLLEVLLAVALVALAASLGVGLLATSTAASSVRAAESAIIDLDRRARLIARRGSTVDLCIELDGTLTLRTSGGEMLAKAQLLGQVDIINVNGERVSCIRFDRAGHSQDYEVHLTIESSSRHLKFAGLTGDVTKGEAQ